MRGKIIELLKAYVPADMDVVVSVSEDSRFGHYSTNIPFRLAKENNASPFAVAHKIAKDLEELKIFEKVEVAPPGFINMWLKDSILVSELSTILKNKKNRKTNKQRIQVEFISANPTGPLTLANGRGGFLGDVLSNVLAWSGAKVEREYYVNDTGNQIITFGKSFLASTGYLPEEDTFYKGDYIKAWAKKNVRLVKKYKNDPLLLGQRAAQDFLKGIKRSIQKKAHIIFDRYTSEESHIHKKSFLKKIQKVLESAGVVYEKDGAMWFKTTLYGDDKDRVIITRDKFPTYFLADAAHYLETKQRKFNLKINILGPDHFGYVARIQAAAKVINLDSKVIVTQAIRLIENGEEVKMSKRKGRFVAFEDLIDEVGVDVARFMFLMVSPDTHLDFDLGKAKERSMRNPVYYVQYAAVRAGSILQKLGNRKWKTSAQSGAVVGGRKQNLGLLNTEEDRRLILKLIQLDEVLEDCAQDFAVHRLTRYASELAKAFHNFYEKERVAGEEKELMEARAALVQASFITFKKLFGILGISSPKKM